MGGAESRQRAKPPRNPSRLADRPSPPGKPQLVPSDRHSPEPDVVTIKWDPPLYDGGLHITGYLVEHRRTGSPHWVRSSPELVRFPELTLSGLEPGWRYQFRVSAQNAAGLSEPGELSDLLTVTLQRTAASAPYFVRELRDTVAVENEKGELTVQVRGTPTPQVAWFKDGVEIFSSRSYRILTDNEISTLVIHQAALSDEGEIKCSATNRVGYAVSRAKLAIEAPPSIRLPRQYEEGLLFEKDEVIRLKVSVAGRPVPTVTWQLNGESVPGGGRYEVSNSERYATLRVGEARRSDRGEYQVRAVNKLGEDIASFLVTVADRPVPPGTARVVMTLGRSVTLSWTAPEDDGGCKIGNYIVEYYRLGWNMWLKAATCRQLSTTLGELIEGSEYKFRVKAENPYGVSDPGPESDVVFIPDPKRGLLEPPEHKPEEDESSMDQWLDEKKRAISVSPTIDNQYGEKKTKKKRGPVAVPEQMKPSSQPSTLSEDSMSPPPTPEHIPIIPKRRIKGEKLDLRRELQEGKELARILEEKRKVEEFKKFELRKAEEMKRTEEIRKMEERKKREELKKNEELKKKVDKTKSDLKMKEVVYPQSPKLPRTEENPLHGSSEFMLVLLPHSRATTEERETSKRELFESSMALEGDVPPPMSLSAPELGSGDPPEPLPVRTAFSSTELLHDQAMARFYHDLAQEEAESLRRRGSLKRRQSFGSRTRVTTSLQDLRSSTRSLSERVDKLEKQSSDKQNKSVDKTFIIDQPEFSTSIVQPNKKAISRDSMDSVLSIEELHKKPHLQQQPSEEDMEYEDSSFDEDEEEDEYDEEEEESLTDDIVEEEEEEEFSGDDKRASLYTLESEDDIRSLSLMEEEDTYHPRSQTYNEDTLMLEYEGRGPLLLISPNRVSQEKESPTSQVNSSSDEVKIKPILKKSLPEINVEVKPETDQTNYNLITNKNQKIRSLVSPEKRFEPNFNPILPKPILKVRETSQERLSPTPMKNSVPNAKFESEINILSSSRSNINEGSDLEIGLKKKQVRIEEPDNLDGRVTTDKNYNNTPSSKTRSESLGDDGDTAKVLIDHYSDIVREYGQMKRTPKTLYLNYEALKAAAEQEEKMMSHIPEIVVNEPDIKTDVEKEEKYDAKIDVSSTIVKNYVTGENSLALESPIKKLNSSPLKEPSPPKYELPKHYLKSKSPSPEKIKKRSSSPRKPRRHAILQNVEEEPPPKKTEYLRTSSPIMQPLEVKLTERKVHSYFDFFMDFSLFILACWLYLFKDERLAIPVLFLMIYRQAHEAFRRKMEALRNKLPRRFLFWRHQ